MATIFPTSPAPQVNDEYQGYRYNGTSWEIIGIDLFADYQTRITGLSNTELGYLDGVTSAIQTQLNAKAPLASPTFTGTVTIPTLNLTNALGYAYGGTGLTTLGAANQVLKVNSGATAIEWGTLDALPSQTGNDWKFLQTDGTNVSWSNALEALYFEFQGVGMDRDVFGYAELTKSPAGINFSSYNYTGGESGGNLNIYAQGTLGLNSPTGVTIWSDLESTGPTTGALVVYGGIGVSKDVWIDGDLHVNGTTVTKTTSTNITSSSATIIATIPIPSGKEVISSECLVLISSTSDGTYYTSKCLVFGGYPFGVSTADITEYAIMGDMDATLSAARVGSNIEISVQITGSTNSTAKVISTSIAADNSAT